MENKKNSLNKDYDEIDLRDVADVLVKRKKIIIFCTLAALGVALAASLMMPKIYRVQTALEIGTVDGGVLVESIVQIKDRVDRGYYSEFLKKEDTAIYPIKTANTAGSDIITLAVESPDRESALSFLENIGQMIIAEHNKLTAARRQFIDSQIAAAEFNSKDISASIKAPSQECSAEKYLAINNLESHILNLKFVRTQITDTAIAGASAAPETPVKPNIKLNAVMAAILGLFFGVFAVLFGNWWRESGMTK